MTRRVDPNGSPNGTPTRLRTDIRTGSESDPTNERTNGLTKKVLRNRQILQLGQRARAHTEISSLGAAL